MSIKLFGKRDRDRPSAREYGRGGGTTGSVNKIMNQLTSPNLPLTPGIALFICDPQVDLHKGGKMPLPYADEISQKIAQLISTFGDSIDEIYVSMQQRPSYHIGHPSYWQDSTGKPPEVFVHIDGTDVSKKNYLASNIGHAPWASKYFDHLKKGRFPTSSVVVFPEHCVVGSSGAAVVDSIHTALRAWEKNRLKCVKYITKGTCSLTEQYSVFQPCVSIKEDPSTAFNSQLLHQLCQHKRVVVVGHMLSHAVKYTVLDFANNAPAKTKTNTALVLVQDFCSTLRDFRNGCVHFLETIQKDTSSRIVLSNSSKLRSIFDLQEEDESIFLAPGVALFAHSKLRNFTSSRANIGVGDIKNDQFFNFDENGTSLLGDGCYMIFDHRNFGSLRAIWYRASSDVTGVDLHQLRSCLGFFKPGFGAKIPDFKFENDVDAVLELARDIDRDEHLNSKRMFEGILNFVHECVKYRGTFILKASDESEDIFLDAGLYGLDSNNNVINIDVEYFVDPSLYAIISCIPKSANAYKGISKQTVSAFVDTGEKLGATIQFSK